ncbi:MAG: hypothetical protein GY789_23370 [Hyphomicrobiales bacterium]|nr:hypothetical protein [Hyphomicrobiales bacterium]MCP4998158.1 hypothetical protein [Hyphomicrobiales bacterium]
MTTRATLGHKNVALGNRALIVCDVDEVVLEFVTPFNAFLKANGYELLPRSFSLTGNIVSLDDRSEAASDKVSDLLDWFFAEQLDWQKPAGGVDTALSNLSQLADIVFLTAMPPHHYDVRRALLDRHDLPYPLIATMEEKGPLISEIHAHRNHPLIFIDDMIYNLHSVKKHVPDAYTISYMSNDHFRAMAPHPGDGVVQARDWPDIEQIIHRHMGT